MLTRLDVECENGNAIIRPRDDSKLEQRHNGSTPPMDGGTLELVFPKYWKALENQLLNL